MARGQARVARDVLSVQVPGGSVLLHVPTGRYLRVNESATTIVGLLSGGCPPPEAARRLAASAGISEETAGADVQSVVDALCVLRRAGARPLRAHRVRSAARLALQWRRVPHRLRWPALQVVALLCIVELGLRTLDLRHLCRLARAPLCGTGDLRPAPAADVSQLSPAERRRLWAIEWLDGRWLTTMTCLRRAVVTGFVLRRRAPVLRLGATNGGATAHAWIEAEGAGYGAEAVVAVFAAPGVPAPAQRPLPPVAIEAAAAYNHTVSERAKPS